MRSLTWTLLFRLTFVLFFTLAFFQLASFVTNETILPFDHTIISIVQGWENDSLTIIMKGFTALGDAYTVIVLSIVVSLILLRYRQWPQFIVFAFTMGSSAVANYILKHTYMRERPMIHRLSEISGFSFPSGHTMGALSFYMIVAFILWQYTHTARTRILLFMIAITMTTCIAISRIYLGVHYPSDIIGGVFATSAILVTTTMSYTLYTRAIEKRFE